MPVEIFEMKLEDYEEIYSLWKTTEGIGLHDYCDSKEGIANYLKRNPGLSFVARDNYKIIGTVLCGHDGRRGYLHHLAVAPGHRRKGIGKTLAETVLEQLRSLGIRKCHLFVFSENDNAQEFWQKIGWKNRTDLKIMSKDIG
jgi:N-acetylglutamate synthase